MNIATPPFTSTCARGLVHRLVVILRSVARCRASGYALLTPSTGARWRARAGFVGVRVGLWWWS